MDGWIKKNDWSGSYWPLILANLSVIFGPPNPIVNASDHSR